MIVSPIKARGPQPPPRDSSPGWAPEVLLGPLNEVEQLNAPTRLYTAGDTALLRRTLRRVAIVGARKSSPEGRRRARRLAVELTKAGIVVVSGLAEGIDTAAHEGAIEAGGSTVAVLGTPLDTAYPRQNQELQARIMRYHLALTQFPLGQPVQRQNFPRRNRVMALVSDATVIVEAGNSSGSISQGWEALRLGRYLFILRSAVEAPGLTWPQEFLRYGAQVLAETRTLLRLLPSEAGSSAESLAPF